MNLTLQLEGTVTAAGQPAGPRGDLGAVTLDIHAGHYTPDYAEALAYMVVRTLGLKLTSGSPWVPPMVAKVRALLLRTAVSGPDARAWGWRPVGARYAYCPFASRAAVLAAVAQFTTLGEVEVGRVRYVAGGAGTGGLEDPERVSVARDAGATG